jgi:formylglycine-generating enzyme required for sulfatase activity/serine/threonine protein kinase
MQCDSCGCENTGEARFCVNCGKKQSAVELDEGLTCAPTLPNHLRSSPPSSVELSLQQTCSNARPQVDYEAPGQLIGDRYQIIRPLGQGTLCAVYLASDTKPSMGNREVAIKRVLNANNPGVHRFLRECEAISTFNQNNLRALYDRGEDANGPFLVMEYIDGRTLHDRVTKEGELDDRSLADLATGLCKALFFAHTRSVIHRDVKPENVMFSSEGIPKLTDFGMAHLEHQDGVGLEGSDYLSPEQRRDVRLADHRSDVFGLGGTLYFAATGESPKVIRSDRIPRNWRSIILRCLEEKPENRFFSVDHILQSLEDARPLPTPNPTPVPTGRGEGSFTCPGCKQENPKDKKFCISCGKGLFATCPQCGGEDREGIRFCGGCGLDIPGWSIALKHVQLAKKQLAAGEFLDAEKEAKFALNAAKGMKEAKRILSEAQQKERTARQDRDDAIANERAMEHFAAAEEHFADSDYSLAEQQAQLALELIPGLSAATEILKESTSRLEAIKDARESAQSFEADGNFEAAESDWRTIFELLPQDEEALQAISSISAKSRAVQHQKLEREAREAFRANDFDVALRCTRTLIDIALPENEGDILDLKEKLLQLRSDLLSKALKEASELLESDNLPKARKRLKRAHLVCRSGDDILNHNANFDLAAELLEGRIQSRERHFAEQLQAKQRRRQRLYAISACAVILVAFPSWFIWAWLDNTHIISTAEANLAAGDFTNVLPVLERIHGSAAIDEERRDFLIQRVSLADDLHRTWPDEELPDSFFVQLGQLEQDEDGVVKIYNDYLLRSAWGHVLEEPSLYLDAMRNVGVDQERVRSAVQARHELAKVLVARWLDDDIPESLRVQLINDEAQEGDIWAVFYSQFESRCDEILVKLSGANWRASSDASTAQTAEVGFQILLQQLDDSGLPKARLESLGNRIRPLHIAAKRERENREALEKLSDWGCEILEQGPEYEGLPHKIVDPQTGITLILIPPGTFKMGSPDIELGRDPVEISHQVTITRPFYLGETEVTQAQWVTTKEPIKQPTMGDDLPMERISWDASLSFCEEAGDGYRLPTEAEWEFACRGGASDRVPFSFGQSIAADEANYSSVRAREVRSYRPNAFGIYEMHGNVSEWCMDRYGRYPKEDVIDWAGPEFGSSRVIRGGFYGGNSADKCRSASRGAGRPSYSNTGQGFRVVRGFE